MSRDQHPSLDIRGSTSSLLAGKRIVHCIAGSVAAIRAPEIARLLLRHGADVIPVMSGAATRIIHPDIMHWATGNRAVTELTGALEHVALAGNVAHKADLMLLAPATANTLGKIAAGIDDTPVTTVITTGLGEHIPLVVVPAMHLSMYNQPFVQENIKRLRDHGITVLLPEISEGKAKIPETAEIVDAVIGMIGSSRSLAGRKVLVTLGRTVEYLDPIRVITNNSSGKMGAAMAEAAAISGACVTIIAGKHQASLPRASRIIETGTSAQMHDAVMAELAAEKYDMVIAAAAVGDFMPVKKASGKISTKENETISVQLVPTPKIIDRIRDKAPDVFLVAFRAISGLTKEKRREDAADRMSRARADLIVVNDTSVPGAGFETDTNKVEVVCKGGELFDLPMGSKKSVAVRVMNIIAEQYMFVKEKGAAAGKAPRDLRA
ncbi:MAG: bifunctional phosphopantothenoylcysteine decarboxylase/phosphopantothenate--cysteine ligase CoaBC [Spirochaetaceae bacterium]|nr:MAG: bifunctional phosphopantothenoylcysteine decarboxylase/phosphopantothenate--cysteine ligase CoaBC [Spirochaetaceae bacterium]